jgi:hypothetical protein
MALSEEQRDIGRRRVRLWVEALRSGKYRQGQGQLKTSTGEYCCLGVACEVSGLGTWSDSREYAVGSWGSRSTLPLPVMEWYGFESGDPRVNWYDGRPAVSRLNDNAGATFDQIAYAIEKEFLSPLK